MKARRRVVLGTFVLLIIACCCVSTSLAQDSPASLATKRQTQVIVTITDTPGRYVGGLHKDQVTMLGIFTTDWTREPKELISGFDKLQSVKPSQSVTTYDALEAGIKKMGDTSHIKRAVIMISDLNDPGSTPKRDQVLEMLKRSKVLVYAIVVDTLLPRSSVRPALDRICSLSGGFSKDARNTAEFLDLMEIISLELRHQYLISFIPSGSAGDWHRLSFAVKPLTSSSKKIEKVPLFIRGREGYYLNH